MIVSHVSLGKRNGRGGMKIFVIDARKALPRPGWAKHLRGAAALEAQAWHVRATEKVLLRHQGRPRKVASVPRPAAPEDGVHPWTGQRLLLEA